MIAMTPMVHGACSHHDHGLHNNVAARAISEAALLPGSVQRWRQIGPGT